MVRWVIPGSIVGIFVLTSLSGCLGGEKPLDVPEQPIEGAVDLVEGNIQAALERLTALRQEPMVINHDITINAVLVGIDLGLIDTQAIAEKLPKSYSPDITYTPVSVKGLRSGLNHRLHYQFHQAPEEFGRELFAYYPSISQEDAIPTKTVATTGFAATTTAPGFLTTYDQMYNLGRAKSGKLHLVDAEKAEQWIEDHRDEYGLRFEKPQYTVFFLDSWTQYKLWPDSFYWYEFKHDLRPTADTENMRAWGGTFDFLFMDYSAAPNDSTTDNSAYGQLPIGGGPAVGAVAAEGTAWNDPPMWHYKGDTATMGVGTQHKTVKLGDRIFHALNIAVNIRQVGDYAGRPVYKPTYYVNVHLWHDGRSIMPKTGLNELLDAERLFGGLQQEIPWARVIGSIKTYVAPTDDPGMDATINRAKAEAVGTHVAYTPIYQYVDANKEKYKQNRPDVFDVMALLFLFEGDYTIYLPHLVGGVAFGGPDGTFWGTISNVNDFRYLYSYKSDMKAVGTALEFINSHEIGHFFGLTHAHDGTCWTGTRYVECLDHTWSSTRTAMSYRMHPFSIDTFHRDIIARAHALENLEQTLRNTHSAYRGLAAQSLAETPADIADALRLSTEHYNLARRFFLNGEYQEAVRSAIDARAASELAMEKAGVTEKVATVAHWTKTGVNSVGAKNSAVVFRPGVVASGVQYDYKPFLITDELQRITVRATWENSPASWGDFFVGWTRRPDLPVNAGPAAYGAPVSICGGIHDVADEKPTDGAITRDFSLDLDTFPVLRNNSIVWLGAGTQGPAVNGAYTVDVIFTYRDHANGFVPSGPAPNPPAPGLESTFRCLRP